MPLKKQTFNADEIEIYDEAVVYKRGEYWQMRMWLGKEKKYARFSLRTRNRDTAIDKAKKYYHELMAAQTKGNKARKVWFAEKIRVELAAYVAAHKPKQLTQPLFYTQRSEGFTANTLTHIVNGIYKNAGISGATSHSGRRTGLTNLAERGVGVRVLMALAGHSNMATTQRYIDLRPAMLKAAVELV